MRRTPDERACDWVRDRLPLLAAGDGSAPGEAADDRLAAEAHLVGCAPCRARRDGLKQALDALSAAAAVSPVEPHAPSLWPALQSRIAESPRPRRSTRPGSARPRRQATAPTDLGLAPARLDRDADVGDRSLLSWIGPVGALAAAALLALLVGLPLAERSRTGSTARIEAAAAPLPPPFRPLPLAVAPSRLDPTPTSETTEPADLALLGDMTLARSDDPPLLDPDGRPLDAPRPTAPPATHPAVRFELDRGIPMPPDARVARPAY